MNENSASGASVEAKELLNVETDRQVTSIRYSPDGKLLLGAGYDAFIHCWDCTADEPSPLEPLSGHHGWVQSLEFNTAGTVMMSADSWGQLRAWDVVDGQVTKRWNLDSAHDGWIHDLAVSFDGTIAATVGFDRVLRIWSVKDGEIQREFPRHEHPVHRVAIHPNGNDVVTSDLFGTIRNWSISTGVCDRKLTFENMHFYDRIQDVPGIYALAFDPNGSLTVAGGEPARIQNHQGIPTIHRLDHTTFKVVSSQKFGVDKDGFVFDLAWHSDGFYVAVTSGNPGAGQLLLIRPEEDEPFFRYTKMANCHGLAMHPNGNKFVVSATNRNSQGNGAVRDKAGSYLGNSSPLHLFELTENSTEPAK